MMMQGVQCRKENVAIHIAVAIGVLVVAAQIWSRQLSKMVCLIETRSSKPVNSIVSFFITEHNYHL